MSLCLPSVHYQFGFSFYRIIPDLCNFFPPLRIYYGQTVTCVFNVSFELIWKIWVVWPLNPFSQPGFVNNFSRFCNSRVGWFWCISVVNPNSSCVTNFESMCYPEIKLLYSRSLCPHHTAKSVLCILVTLLRGVPGASRVLTWDEECRALGAGTIANSCVNNVARGPLTLAMRGVTGSSHGPALVTSRGKKERSI